MIFDKLSNQAPSQFVTVEIPEGEYPAKVYKSEIRTTTKGARYLNILWQVLDANGQKLKNLFDVIMDPDEIQEPEKKKLPEWKIKCLIEALGLTELQSKSFELKDFPKLINGKDCILNIQINKKAKEEGRDPNQVNVFGTPYKPSSGKPVPKTEDTATSEDNF